MGFLNFHEKQREVVRLKLCSSCGRKKKKQTFKNIKLIEKPQKGHLFSEKAVFNIKKFWFGTARCNISRLCRIS